MEISKITTTVRNVQGWYEKSMVRNAHGTKSPRMVRNVYGTNSLWYEKSGNPPVAICVSSFLEIKILRCLTSVT